MNYKSIIKKLELIKHPEGGYYRETYRSEGTIPQKELPPHFRGERNYVTLIYYMLVKEDISRFHKLNSDEVWHFYEGSPLIIYIINKKGVLNKIKLGNNILRGEVFHAVIKAGSWFGAELIDKTSYSLVGCCVAPGFHFDDFVLGRREELLKKYPVLAPLINKMT